MPTSEAANGEKYLTWKEVSKWAIPSIGALCLLILGAVVHINNQTVKALEVHSARPHPGAASERDLDRLQRGQDQIRDDIKELLQRIQD